MRRVFLLGLTVFAAVFLFSWELSFRAADRIEKYTKTEEKKALGIKSHVYEENIPYITLIIDAGGMIKSSYILDIQENTSPFSLLEKVKDMGEVTIETEIYDFGVLVTSINGFENDNQFSWIYFVNGNMGQVASDRHILKQGDTVEWKYIKPVF